MNDTPNNHAEYDVSPDERKKRDGHRRGKVSRFRLKYGIKTLWRQPWKIIFIAMLGAAFLFCWLNRNATMSQMTADFPILPDIMVPVLSYILYALIIVVFILLLLLLLCVLGLPRRARKIDKAIVDIFKNDVGYGYWPIFLSRQREGSTDLWQYEFYSEHLPLEAWEAKSARLVNMLGGYIDSISNGGKNGNDVRYIIVVSGVGARPSERAAALDPLFRK
ncbi:hypothetical protein LJC32_02155 [Oscillospiraceae bacterium OttesenSCG-928-F05]|nr:hypothetical protein [Oscillospiraceae bacterium OttesenSCG-928-F05]